MIAFLIVSAVTFTAFISYIVLKYGIPESISHSYYLMPKVYAQPVFWGWAVLTAFPLLIFWLEISPDSYRFLVFLSCVSLCFVGTAAAFKENLTRTVHVAAAALSAASSLLWITLNSSLWVAIILFGILFTCIGKNIPQPKARNSIVFFLELACFLITYLTVYIFWINQLK
jgi:hypothetical protein